MVYFSDFFDISEETLQEYGAFNISLINDLPLFIDPFLLFGNAKTEYQKLHEEIINYLVFFRPSRVSLYTIRLCLTGVWPKPTPVYKPLQQSVIKGLITSRQSGFIE